MYSIYVLLPVTILLTTAILGFLHMLAPDHWTPILSYSIKNNINKKKTALISISLGLLHGLFSSLLSLAIVFIGIYFFPVYYVKIFSIFLLVAVAIYIIINAHFESKKNKNNKNDNITKSILLVSVIPDPAIVPFILLAIFYGKYFVYITVILFITISSLSLLFATVSLRKIIKNKISKLTPRNVDYMVSFILLLTALYVVL